MKWLDGLVIWYLRKRKVSVFINFKTNGSDIQQKYDTGYFYDLELSNNKILLSDGKTEWNMPKGKFKQEFTLED